MYDALARYYDIFASTFDYDEWRDFICGFLPGKRGVDVGCGSGAFTLRLATKGYSVTGIDLSEDMVQAAYLKAAKSGLKTVFAVGNCEKAAFGSDLDFVTAICDVVNYLKNPELFFKNARKSLKKGGVLVFDVSSRAKIENVLANNVFTDEKDGVLYVWSNTLGKNKIDMFLTFFEKSQDGKYVRADEEQTQYIHDEQVLVRALENAGFEEVRVYDGYKSKKATMDSERLVFVAKAK
jgi:SAM-dependent methyltransferase